MSAPSTNRNSIRKQFARRMNAQRGNGRYCRSVLISVVSSRRWTRCGLVLPYGLAVWKHRRRRSICLEGLDKTSRRRKWWCLWASLSLRVIITSIYAFSLLDVSVLSFSRKQSNALIPKVLVLLSVFVWRWFKSGNVDPARRRWWESKSELSRRMLREKCNHWLSFLCFAENRVVLMQIDFEHDERTEPKRKLKRRLARRGEGERERERKASKPSINMHVENSFQWGCGIMNNCSKGRSRKKTGTCYGE